MCYIISVLRISNEEKSRHWINHIELHWETWALEEQKGLDNKSNEIIRF